jgi:histidinol-phosphate/aromatic aminotransferase/cobyric acid decarboxylase-like protein
MQIAEKYQGDYEESLVRLKAERDRFQKELAGIVGIRVIPSQANFVMVELEAEISPTELLKKLLVRRNLLIKELTTKTNGRNYLRLAVRNKEDNDLLLVALKKELRCGT